LQGGVDLLGVAAPQSDVQHGLHDPVHPRQALAAEVAQVAEDGGGLVGDGTIEHLGEQCGDLVESDGLRAGQVVAAAVMSSGGEHHAGHDVAEVAYVVERDATVPGGDHYPVVVADVAAVGVAEVLGEEPGTQDGPGQPRCLQVGLDPMVWDDAVGLRPGHRGEHHVLHAPTGCFVDQGVQRWANTGDRGWAQQEHRAHVLDRAREGRGVGQVERDRVDAGQAVVDPGGVTAGGAHREARVHERRDDGATDVAEGTDDEDGGSHDGLRGSGTRRRIRYETVALHC
jgi:hypothetical protein